MKRRSLAFLILLISLCLTLASCLIVTPPDDGPQQGPSGDDFIWQDGSVITLIPGESADRTRVNDLYSAISSLESAIVYTATTEAEEDGHELVIGKCDRSISRLAYTELAKITVGEHEYAYLIYSDGKSVCIAYNDVDAYISYAADAAVAYFKENMIKSELVLTAGVVHSGKINAMDLAIAEDAALKDERWAALEEYLGDNNGKEIVVALKELFTLYDPEMITWLAELYDPAIGGFYYSKSGLRTEGYLPDAESTSQTLRILTDCGVLIKHGNNYAKAIPAEMREQIIDFIYNLQDSNGYFYHPQWSKDLVNQKTSRRSRDLGHCTGILSKFGVKPKYTPANQTATEDMAYIAPLTTPLGNSSAIAVSRVIAAESASGETYSPFLENIDTFKTWLSKQNIATGSYGIGNNLTSIYSDIKNRDQVLGTFNVHDSENSMIGYLIYWLNENQNPENGLWHAKSDYYGVNGLMKISGVYSKSGVPMPNSSKAVEAAIAAMTTDEESTGITCIYNTWYAVNRVLNIMNQYGTEADAEEAAALRQRVYEVAPAAIRATRDKLTVYRKEQGSSSYNPETTIANSQGCPVAIAGSVEGDVNATCMATTDTLNYIWGCLAVPSAYKVFMFGTANWLEFLDVIESATPVIKEPSDFVEETVADFDDEDVGTEPSGNAAGSINSTSLTYGSSITVVEDMRPDSTGNVAMIDSRWGKDKIIFSLADPRSTTCFIFESEMCIESHTKLSKVTADDGTVTYVPKSSSTGADAVQIFMGDCYYLYIRNQGDCLGFVDSTEGMSNVLGPTVDFSEWFKIRIEYYVGDHDSVRIMTYLNDELVAISDNYYDGTGGKLVGIGVPCSTYTNTRIYIPSATQTKLYVDNMMTCKTNDLYEKPTDPDLDLGFNVDRVIGGEESFGGDYYNDSDYEGTRYDFSTEPDVNHVYNRTYDKNTDVTTTTSPLFASIEGERLFISNAANWQGLAIATDEAYYGNEGDIYVFEADITWMGGQMSTGHSAGAAFIGLLGEHKSVDNENMFCYNYLKFTEGESDSATFFGATLERGVTYNICLEYEVGTGILTYYVDGEEVATSYNTGKTNGSDEAFYGFGIYMRKSFTEPLEILFDNVYMGVIEN